MSADQSREAQSIALLADNSLILRVDPSVSAIVDAWLPRYREPASDERAASVDRRAELRVLPSAENVSTNPEAIPPTLVLGGVRAYVGADDARLYGVAGLRGAVDLRRRRATVFLDVARGAADFHGGLTLAVALLLGRLERALAHAAAIVDPLGRGWLLVGDSHAGKTTTCATLIGAGWSYVADDQIVLSQSDDGVFAEGWPKQAHLDPGWSEGRITTTRVGVELATLRSGAWVPHTMVKGVLFPAIDAERPTSLVQIAQADALGRLIRQSPWLLADPEATPDALSLLSRVAATSCFALSLGRDSYANGERLAAVLAPITRIG